MMSKLVVLRPTGGGRVVVSPGGYRQFSVVRLGTNIGSGQPICTPVARFDSIPFDRPAGGRRSDNADSRRSTVFLHTRAELGKRRSS